MKDVKKPQGPTRASLGVTSADRSGISKVAQTSTPPAGAISRGRLPWKAFLLPRPLAVDSYKCSIYIFTSYLIYETRVPMSQLCSRSPM
jgi:hypothetical protein